MTESLHIENAAALTSVFGRWPSFHDAEVISIQLDRSGDDGPSLEARVHVFCMTSDVDARGFFVLTDHTLVSLRFSNLILLNLKWFNAQNSLSDLSVQQVSPAEHDNRAFRVSFNSNHGVELELLCDRIAVRSVESFVPTG